MSKTKILLVDDHKLVRDGIASVLNSTNKYQIIGEAANGKEAVEAVFKLNPDLVLMDINMPLLDGVEAAHQIRKKNKSIKIIILTMMEEDRYILDALSADINGYLFKMTGIDDLLFAVESVISGENYFDSRVTKVLVNKHKSKKEDNVTLSKREVEILSLITSGVRSRQIAEQLFISVFTVQKHRKNILKKLNLHSIAELVKYGIEHNYLQK
ncbi:MAG: response regulator transcription factor [Ignavibacteriaceae bacterium]|nr:response regulator transcription factor [Ignavibacteriaceae bacterium]